MVVRPKGHESLIPYEFCERLHISKSYLSNLFKTHTGMSITAYRNYLRLQKAKILLETTAGQGSSVGCRIEHLGRIFRTVGDPDRLGVCLDTCHLFAAGYDLSTPDEYARTIDLLRRQVTLGKIKCVHMNDSKGACGSRLDRHEHIGKGRLGLAGFRHVVNDERLARVPKILETPKGTDGRGTNYDKVNLRKLRKLVEAA